MAKVSITLLTEPFGWFSYVAAINGDDGPSPDATEEELVARDEKAKQMMLADMGRIASNHAKHRRKAEKAAEIDSAIDAQMDAIIASTIVTVEIIK